MLYFKQVAEDKFEFEPVAEEVAISWEKDQSFPEGMTLLPCSCLIRQKHGEEQLAFVGLFVYTNKELPLNNCEFLELMNAYSTVFGNGCYLRT